MIPLDPQQVTIVALLFAIGAAGLKKLWVWGWAYSEMERDRDFWRTTALQSLGHTEKALDVAERKAKA